jgi:hypothetical protein
MDRKWRFGAGTTVADPGCVKTPLRCYDSLDDSRERIDEALY